MGCGASADHARLTQMEARLAEYEVRFATIEQKLAGHPEQRQSGEATGEVKAQTWTGPAEGGPPKTITASADTPGKLPGVVPASVDASVPVKVLDIPPLAALPSAAELSSRHYVYDVFLSHKRTDCADFARTLSTELATVGGLSCFLDQDADFELGDLMLKVRQSRCLVFILSDAIFKSEWCMLELREALAWKCNIVLLTAHGARWASSEGGPPLHDFPPQNIIPKVVQPAFENKAIEYNRNFHRASVDQLYARIFGRPPRAASAEWVIDSVDGSKAEVFSVDLASIGVELPPTNPLQLLLGYTRFVNHTLQDSLQFSLKIPFHLANTAPPPYDPLASPREFIPPEEVDPLKPIGLHALCVMPSRADLTRAPSSQTYSCLVVDAPLQSVQTGGWSLPKEQRPWVVQEKSHGRWAEKEVRVDFTGGAFPTTPEVFLTLTEWRTGRRNHRRGRISLTAKHVDVKGFTLNVACVGVKSFPHSVIWYELDRVSLQYLAFEPRLNRSWVHGEAWLVNETNHHKQVARTIHFVGDSTASSAGPRHAFQTPPKIFLGLAGLDTDLSGFEFTVKVAEITTGSFVLMWTLWHQPGGFANQKPHAMAIRWLAIPDANAKGTDPE